MQSTRDTATSKTRRSTRASSSRKQADALDFGEGEPYLDGDEDVAYLKKFKQLSGTGVKKKDLVHSKKMSDDDIIYGECGGEKAEEIYEDPNERKRKGSGEKQRTEEEISYDSLDRHQAERDSLEDEVVDYSSSSDDAKNEEYDKPRPTTSAHKHDQLSSKSDTKSVKSASSSRKKNPNNRKNGKRESISERLIRDAMSLKRHQIREREGSPSSDEVDKSPEPNKREVAKDDNAPKSRTPRDKRDLSRSRVGALHSRSKSRAVRHLYGDDFLSKYHQPLPPRSPTFSFRSTIDLLPSSRRKQGLRQQVRDYRPIGRVISSVTPLCALRISI